MVKPIPVRSKDGKHLAGSIGAGKTNTPTTNSLTYTSKEGILKRLQRFRAKRRLRKIARKHNKLKDKNHTFYEDLTIELDGQNRPYHHRVTNFNQETLMVTEKLFSSRPSLLNLKEKNKVFCNWLDTVSKSYNMETPELLWSEDTELNGEFGIY